MDTVVLSLIVIFLIPGYLIVVHMRKLKKRNKLIDAIKTDWDSLKEADYELTYTKELYNMYRYYKNKGIMEIDDITWNDFEMDGIFDKLNYTYSTMGEIYLYNMLRNPTSDIKILQERDRIIEYFSSNSETRVKKQYQLSNIGKFNRASIYEYKDIIGSVQRFSLLPHIIIPILHIVSVVFVIINAKYGIIFFLVMLTVNLMSYYKRNKMTETYLPIIMQIGTMLNSMKEMDDLKEINELSQYSEILSKTTKFRRTYRKYFRFFGMLTFGNLPDIDMMYDSFIKPFFHTDIIVFSKLINLIKNNMELLIESYETVGFLDSMIAVAAFRHKTKEIQGDFMCKPSFCQDAVSYSAEDIYNPLLLKPVTNSINTTDSVLITGSNATGKSTFLRTIGLNAILAQSIYTVCASKYSTSIVKIMSSMSLKDNIYSGESYYMMEIKALKRILSAMNEEIPILCCIDEVLRGTNTIERIAASSKILENLAQNNVLCFVASHDLELTYIIDEFYNNYHFQENVDSDGIVCDFKLYNGRSYTRNAINLLKFFGYSDEIIEDAKKRANLYIESGKWGEDNEK